MSKFKNKKTGKVYDLVTDKAICTTNAYDGQRLVVYMDDLQVFVRSYDEFYEKFNLVDTDE